MYSLVLMAALTTGGETPSFGHLFGHGCHGCHGGCYGGCHGCYGGCYGGSYGGCYGGCHGYYGGCYGCYGGCYGAGYGCYGYAGYTAIPAYGCYGCYGGYGCYGASSYSPVIMPDSTIIEKKEVPPVKKGAALPAPARILVKVPADAKLYIDNRLMKSTSASRAYSTPALQPGQTYYYEVRAEVVRDGKAVSETQKVLVRAGQESRTVFAEPTTAVASSASGN